MREIRFRGFSMKENRWVTGSLLQDMAYDWETGEEIPHILESVGKGGDSFSGVEGRIHPVDTRSLGEYIGVLDTAYRQVYTGDQVMVSARNGQRFEAIVVYDLKLKAIWLRGETFSCSLRAIPCTYTIIGNVFDQQRQSLCQEL